MSFNAGDIEATLTLDRDPFQRGLAQARRDGEQFERKDYTATVDANTRPFDRALRGAATQLGNVVRQVGSVKVAAVASLAAIAPAAVYAAGAIAGIGVAAGGVLAPLGLLGAGMALAFKQGGPQVEAFKRSLEGLKTSFGEATRGGALAAFSGLTDLFKDLRSIMPGLESGFTRLGRAVGESFRSIGGQLSSNRFREFYDVMLNMARRAVPPLTRVLKGLLDVFRNIATAAAPLFVRGLKMLAEWLGRVGQRTSDIGALRGALQEGVKALGQLWNIAKGLGGILRAVFTAASDGANGFLASIGRTVNKLSEFFNSAKGQEILKDTLSSLAIFVKEIGDAIPYVVSAFGKLLEVATSIWKVAVGLLKVLEKIPLIGPGLAAVAIGFAAWKGPLWVAQKALASVWGLLGKIKAARVGPVVGGVARGAAPAAGARVLTAGSPLAATAATTAAASTAGAAAGGGFLARFMARVKGLPGLIGGLFRGLGPRILPVLAAGLAAIGPFLIRTVPRFFARVLPRILGVVAGWPVAIAALIFSLLPGKVKDAIWRGIKSILGAVVTAGKWIAQAIGKGIKAAASAVVSAAKSVGEAAWKALRALVGKFLSVGKALIQAVAKGVKAVASAVWNAIKDIGKKALEIIKAVPKLFFEAGKAIIEALANGIKSVALAPVNAVKGILGAVGDLLPGSEPRDRSSPLYGLSRRGEAVMGNIASGVRKGKAALAREMESAMRDTSKAAHAHAIQASRAGPGNLRRDVINIARQAYAPMMNAAKLALRDMDNEDRLREGPPLTRRQREAEVGIRIAQARYATDERGNLLNLPPPGVARRPDAAERDALRELDELRREFRREDLERVANINVKTMIPSDPKTLREVQRGFGRAVGQGRRRRPRRVRLA